MGLWAYYHDSAAALIVDGRIIAAAQEERFTRRKHDPGFSSHAIDYCLAAASITAADLDLVGFYDKPLLKFDRLLETYLAYAPAGFRSFALVMPLWLGEKLHLPREMGRALGGGYRRRFVFAEHHESHAASAFFPYPFEEAAVLTVDGVGEWATASLGIGRGNRVEISHELRFPHSRGLLYSVFTCPPARSAPDAVGPARAGGCARGSRGRMAGRWWRARPGRVGPHPVRGARVLRSGWTPAYPWDGRSRECSWALSGTAC